jgi:hypothetical protein
VGAAGAGGVVTTRDGGDDGPPPETPDARDARDGADAPDASAVSYLGCFFGGGIDRIVVAKRDLARDLCFNVVLDSPGQPPPAGLTLPPGFGLERAGSGPAILCPSRGAVAVAAASVNGAISVAGGDGSVIPTYVNVAVTLTFAANDAGAPATESLSAQAVGVLPACPDPICTVGADQTCNDNLAISSLHGHCTDIGTCVCNVGAGINPATGRCL